MTEKYTSLLCLLCPSATAPGTTQGLETAGTAGVCGVSQKSPVCISQARWGVSMMSDLGMLCKKGMFPCNSTLTGEKQLFSGFCSVSFTTLVIEFAISLHPVTSNIAPGSLTKNTWRGPYCMVWVHSPCCYFQSSMQFCNFQVSLDFGACCHLYCEEMLYALHCFLDHL